MVQPVVEANSDHVLRQMELADYGEHNLLVYPDLDALTRVYSQYFKSRLQANMELILFLSTYQSVNQIKSVLRDTDLDLAGYEENSSLVILDSVKGYFGSDSDILALVKVLSRQAKNQGKVGSSIFADMGLFNLFGKEKDLFRYEVSMPPKFDGHINNPIMCKTFCMYHWSDFNRLSETEKAALFEHHYRKLIITDEVKSATLDN